MFLLLLSVLYIVRLQKQLKDIKLRYAHTAEHADRLAQEVTRSSTAQILLEHKQTELEKSLKNKTLKLAVIAKENLDKDRALNQVKAKVLQIENNLTKKLFVKTRIAETRRLLNEHCNHEDHTFEMQIDEIHLNFFKTIKEIYPDLTNYDLRLCAYLKMGMNTKEIAEIVNVLPSSINVSRSRLRKKLNLDPSEDLFKFLYKFEE